MRISDWSSDVCSSDLSLGYQKRAISAERKPTAATRPDMPRMVMVWTACSTSALVATFCMAPSCTAQERDSATLRFGQTSRAEERSVGTECVRTFSYRWARDHDKKRNHMHDRRMCI